jgi:GT2 family glycosyltransferase
MKSPRLSYIIVTRSRAQWLSGAIGSIRRQATTGYEIVVIINGKDPDTERLIEALEPEVRAVTLKMNHGVGGGRNAGVALAKGEILVFLDDDAELRDANAAEMVLQHFERDERLGAVGFLVVDAETGRTDHRCIPFRQKRLPSGATEACYFPGGACAIRRQIFDKVGPYDPGLFYSGEELDLSYRLLEAGYTIRFDPTIVVDHFRAGGNRQVLTSFFDVRNRPWIALRYLPLRCCVSHCLVWWGWGALRGLRDGEVKAALRGIRDSARGLPVVWQTRQRISDNTWRRLIRDGGRLWY